MPSPCLVTEHGPMGSSLPSFPWYPLSQRGWCGHPPPPEFRIHSAWQRLKIIKSNTVRMCLVWPLILQYFFLQWHNSLSCTMYMHPYVVTSMYVCTYLHYKYFFESVHICFRSFPSSFSWFFSSYIITFQYIFYYRIERQQTKNFVPLIVYFCKMTIKPSCVLVS